MLGGAGMVYRMKDRRRSGCRWKCKHLSYGKLKESRSRKEHLKYRLGTENPGLLYREAGAPRPPPIPAEIQFLPDFTH